MQLQKRKLKKFTKGAVSTFTDAVLATFFYGLEFATHGRGGASYSAAARSADKDFERFNSETIARALRELRRKGLVQAFKEKNKELQITEAGRARLESILPHYDPKRAWDGILYLVTYDIPVEHNKDRSLLWRFLKKIGCGLLQESLWITPYNPKKLLEEFIGERGLHGMVLVSYIGKDGSIGGMEFEELLERVYGLSELNRRYTEFIAEYRQRYSRAQATFHFLSILADDPQLPFELLPEDWVGDEAYQIFRRTIK